MPTLSITNNGPNPQSLYDQKSGWSMYIVESTTTAKSLTGEQLLNLEVPLAALAAKVDSTGDALFSISVTQDVDDSLLATPGSADVARWIGNHVSVDLAESNPTAASTTAAWRVNHNAGEAYVGGQHFVVGAQVSFVGDASVDKTGTAFAGPLGTNEDRYAYFVMVNNAGSLEQIFVFGDAFGTGLAEELTDAEIATAVGGYLSLTGASYNYVKAATILFEEATGLTQTTTSKRDVPGSF